MDNHDEEEASDENTEEEDDKPAGTGKTRALFVYPSLSAPSLRNDFGSGYLPHAPPFRTSTHLPSNDLLYMQAFNARNEYFYSYG